MSVAEKAVRKIALAFPDTVENAHMEHADFRVRNKIFATLPGESRCCMKCDATSLAHLVSSDPKTFEAVWGGRWLGINLTRVDEALLAELMEDSWCMTAPKTLVKEYKQNRRDS